MQKGDRPLPIDSVQTLKLQLSLKELIFRPSRHFSNLENIEIRAAFLLMIRACAIGSAIFLISLMIKNLLGNFDVVTTMNEILKGGLVPILVKIPILLLSSILIFIFMRISGAETSFRKALITAIFICTPSFLIIGFNGPNKIFPELAGLVLSAFLLLWSIYVFYMAALKYHKAKPLRILSAYPALVVILLAFPLLAANIFFQERAVPEYLALLKRYDPKTDVSASDVQRNLHNKVTALHANFDKNILRDWIPLSKEIYELTTQKKEIAIAKAKALEFISNNSKALELETTETGELLDLIVNQYSDPNYYGCLGYLYSAGLENRCDLKDDFEILRSLLVLRLMTYSLVSPNLPQFDATLSMLKNVISVMEIYNYSLLDRMRLSSLRGRYLETFLAISQLSTNEEINSAIRKSVEPMTFERPSSIAGALEWETLSEVRYIEEFHNEVYALKVNPLEFAHRNAVTGTNSMSWWFKPIVTSGLWALAWKLDDTTERLLEHMRISIEIARRIEAGESLDKVKGFYVQKRSAASELNWKRLIYNPVGRIYSDIALVNFDQYSEKWVMKLKEHRAMKNLILQY